MERPWDRVADDGVDLLQRLLRLDTRNPPGNERPAADLLNSELRAVGLEPRLFEPMPDRVSLVCRIQGTGELPPLLLAGHTDVVPFEEARWDHPPLGGELHDGYLFGRGAIDMKNHIAACATIMKLLAERGIKPRRDIIFAAVADEEEGCTWGSRYLVEHHPDEVRAEFMIGEIGGFTQYINGVRYYPIQIAEKGLVTLRMIARGAPGHGSMPHRDMAMTRLGEALAILGSRHLPVHITPTMERFLRTVAATQAPPTRWVLPQLLNPRLTDVLLDRVLPGELRNVLSAQLHNTVSATMIQGGLKFNVIPGEASCTLDGRILPGQRAEDLVRELRALTGDRVEYEILHTTQGMELPDPDSALYRAITETLGRHDPAGIPLPYLVTGFTDAQYFGRLGARCYGFSPLQFPEAHKVRFADLFHGHNERIWVEGWRWGLRVLWDTVQRLI